MSIQLIQHSDILLFPSFPDQPGRYTGKIFDYLASKKNILMFPSDNGVCAELINQCNAGFIANTALEVSTYILKKYLEKQKSGTLEYNGIKNSINYYSRANQAKIMASKILTII